MFLGTSSYIAFPRRTLLRCTILFVALKSHASVDRQRGRY